jgi:hypothetical protein
VRRQIEGGSVQLDLLTGLFNWGMRLAGLAIVVIVGYYVYGITAQSDSLFRATHNGQVMSAADFQRHLANMELLTKVLLAAAIVLVICVLGRFYGYPEAGAAILVVGAVLFFAMPFIIQSFGGVGAVPRQLSRLGDPRGYLESRFQLAGLVLLASGGFFLLIHGFILVGGMRNRRPKADAEAAKTAQQVRKPQDKFLGPCWTLPFCRDTDKKLCPIRQRGKPCWRGGRGCYCDQQIILTISGGSQYQASRGGLGYLSRQANVTRPKSMKEKREQCLQCPVYLHHQGQKYQVLTPAAITLAVGLFVYYWGSISTIYPNAVNALGRSLSGFTFGAQQQGGVPAWATDLATNPGMMWTIVIVIAVLMVAYILHGLEWLLYRLGI